MASTLTGVELVPIESSTATECRRFEYDTETTAASMAVVAALSEVSETDPLSLHPLQESIDVGALDALVPGRGPGTAAVEMTLQVATDTVTVSGDGVVAVTPSTVNQPEDQNGVDSQR